MKNQFINAYFLQISNHMWVSDNAVKLPNAAQDDWNPNNEIDIPTFDELVEYIAERGFNMLVLDVGDGVILKSHPEIAAPDAWSIDFLKEKIRYIESKGIEVIPKLNFSMGHTTWQKEWRHHVCLPDYIPFCREVIREVAEIFNHPRLFHLGMDEETDGCQRQKDVMYIRNEKVLWRHFKELCDEVEKNGGRPWMFSDMYWHRPEEYLRNVPKSVIQSNWDYSRFDSRPKSSDGKPNPAYTAIHTYIDLEEAGYDQIPTMSAYTTWLNADRGIAYCKQNISPEHLLGFITIPWHNTTELEKFILMNDADCFYRAMKKYYPETFEK